MHKCHILLQTGGNEEFVVYVEELLARLYFLNSDYDVRFHRRFLQQLASHEIVTLIFHYNVKIGWKQLTAL